MSARNVLLGPPDDARHVRHARGAGRERQVLDRRPAAVEALERDAPTAAAAADDRVDDLLALDRPVADDRAEEFLERAAEDGTGGRVRGDVVPVVVPDEKAALRR